MSQPLLVVNNLKKTYTTRLGNHPVHALSNISFSVEAGEYVAVMGESGSGKTTLLNLLATLDKPTSGQILLSGLDLVAMKEEEQCLFRSQNLGFVFQDFYLLDTFSLFDNIVLPLVLADHYHEATREKVETIATQLGIHNILDQYPYEVSGGEKQRAAIARAIVTDPLLVLADEPTGALDSNAAKKLLQIFDQIHQQGQTILMVTHSAKVASNANRVLFIRDGMIYHQLFKGDSSQEEMFEKISHTLTIIAQGSD